MTNRNPRMLQGYRVLELGHFVAGPTCAKILGEMGAEVIKVERTLQGDHSRRFGIVKDGASTYFVQHNHGKLCVGLDLKKPRARELVLAMVPKLDVFVENFAPGVIDAMGLGYEELRRINPRLIMCSISVAGQTGPLNRIPGYDYIGAAYAGITGLLGEPDRPPVTPGLAIGDVSTGVAAAMAVGFALLHRERTGEGQYIDASIVDTYFHMHEQNVPVVAIREGRYKARRTGSMHPSMSPCGVFPTRDGYIFIIVQQHEMGRLGRAMGKPDILDDPRFATNRDRMKNSAAMREMIEAWLMTFPGRAGALAALEAHRVPCAPVLTLDEAMTHPQLIERGTVRKARDKLVGEFPIPGIPVRFSAWPQSDAPVEASMVGADNERVMREMLGLSDDEIAALYADGVLIHHTLPLPAENA